MLTIITMRVGQGAILIIRPISGSMTTDYYDDEYSAWDASRSVHRRGWHSSSDEFRRPGEDSDSDLGDGLGLRKRWKDTDNPESMTVGQMASLYLMREAKKRYEPIELLLFIETNLGVLD
ncbi:hypothetical protein Pmar_PMAR005286 [Perkinsus marinus ATCC 50983]|uniref:Uncharacterized protein n=1 Tax=Perkinsus marinus (strain ATCC 50983 / TXsc) TaxID=423536 RepID=C5KB50_PERM5|nr:hypothetical protein Pmar_PMAR005286 [Perkinsus marinus ATCC 50983]EER18376.1 hypothetical protein Pmar_PMAR005286 [Perkinsus marinus ATCC 50983]|eukprot:XP_002786580.1 hypothetical protein Pmar_PMAR005286 [Perkinsus marinus ATCC 50983]